MSDTTQTPESEYADDVVPRDRVWTAILNYVENNPDEDTFTAKDIDTQHGRVLTQQLRAMAALGWLERVSPDGYTYRVTKQLKTLLSSRSR